MGEKTARASADTTQADATGIPGKNRSASPYPPAGAAWGIVALLFLIYTLSFIDRQILALLVEPIKRDLQASDVAFSLLSGFAFALFYTVFGLPFARYADRGSRTGLIAFGVALWSLATAACGLARGFWGLFGARIMVGVGEATLTPAANSLIADLFPPAKLGRALSVYSLGIPIGSAMAFILGGAVVDWVASLPPIDWPIVGKLHGWQIAFVAVGLPGLLFAIVMLVLPEPARRGRRLTGGAENLPLRKVAAYILRHAPAYAPLFFGAAMLSMLGYGATLWMIAFFARVHGLAAGEAGYVFGLILLVCGTGGILLGGTLADLWFARGRRDAHLALLLIGTLLGLPFGIAYPLVDGLVPAVALLAISTLISNMPWGLAYAAIATITPNELRGQMAALYLFIVNIIGLGLGPSVIAVFTDYVFADEAAIGASLAAATAVIAPIAAILFAIGRRPFARAVAGMKVMEQS